MIMACEAGKDVDVEKPVSHTVHEGRRMVEAAEPHDRIVPVGTQRRSEHFQKAVEAVRSGKIGKVMRVHSGSTGIGRWMGGAIRPVRMRPHSSMGITMHRSTVALQPGVLSQKVGCMVVWDPQQEHRVGDEDANPHLTNEYRKPWNVA
jgi:predicted dehydrogenase